MRIKLLVNGKSYSLDAPGEMPLLWVLRDRLRLMGTKFGCGAGFCGACTVHIAGQAARSCLIPIQTCNDQSITTIEGLSGNGHLHALQAAWVAEQVLQCGYCQSGMLMAAAALLPTMNGRESEIPSLMTNLCRCGTYPRIARALNRTIDETAT